MTKWVKASIRTSGAVWENHFTVMQPFKTWKICMTCMTSKSKTIYSTVPYRAWQINGSADMMLG